MRLASVKESYKHAHTHAYLHRMKKLRRTQPPMRLASEKGMEPAAPAATVLRGGTACGLRITGEWVQYCVQPYLSNIVSLSLSLICAVSMHGAQIIVAFTCPRTHTLSRFHMHKQASTRGVPGPTKGTGRSSTEQQPPQQQHSRKRGTAAAAAAVSGLSKLLHSLTGVAHCFPCHAVS